MTNRIVQKFVVDMMCEYCKDMFPHIVRIYENADGELIDLSAQCSFCKRKTTCLTVHASQTLKDCLSS